MYDKCINNVAGVIMSTTAFVPYRPLTFALIASGLLPVMFAVDEFAIGLAVCRLLCLWLDLIAFALLVKRMPCCCH